MKKLYKIGSVVGILLMAAVILVPSNASAQVQSARALACATYSRDLTMGSTGADVAELQSFLVSQGNLVMPAGVLKGYFGSITRAALGRYQAAHGIYPTAGYFGKITRGHLIQVCANSGSNDNDNGGSDDSDDSSDLSGGDGDIQNISETTSGTETTLGEGKTEDVLGFDLEADDNSDLEVSSIKVEITTATGESTRLSRYLDSAAITLDGEEIGSVDASDFSRDGAVSKATISLDKGTIVEAGEESRFYVTLTANDSINDSEQDATLEVAVTKVRVEDAGGAVLTEDPNISVTVDFEDSSENDDARIKKDSDTRDAGLLKVDENTSSDEYDLVSFAFDIDEDSSDLVVLEIPVDLVIVNGSSTGALDAEAMIKDISIEVDGQKYDDYEFESDVTIAAGATETVTVTFTIDEGDLEIAAGDVLDAVVFIKLNEQDGNYSEGTKIAANVVGSEIGAENTEGDVFDLTGTVNGNTQTLQISAASVEKFSWEVGSAGTYVDFIFSVTAEDEDFNVLTSSIASTTSGTATTSAGVLSKKSGDADAISGGFKVLDGDTAIFKVRYTLSASATNGQYVDLTVTSVAGQEVPDEDQQKTVTRNVQN